MYWRFKWWKMCNSPNQRGPQSTLKLRASLLQLWLTGFLTVFAASQALWGPAGTSGESASKQMTHLYHPFNLFAWLPINTPGLSHESSGKNCLRAQKGRNVCYSVKHKDDSVARRYHLHSGAAAIKNYAHTCTFVHTQELLLNFMFYSAYYAYLKGIMCRCNGFLLFLVVLQCSDLCKHSINIGTSFWIIYRKTKP